MLCVPVLQRYVQTTWLQKAMVTLIDYPAPMELFSKAGELRMPFSDVVKYCILGISIILLLLALGILAWQIYRFCTEKYTTYTQQDAGHNDLLYSDEGPTTTGNYSGAPSTKLEDVSTEAHRLSRCLAQPSFPSLASTEAAGDKEEQATIQKVDGSLRFSVYYDQMQSRLVVTVLQVEGLLEQSESRTLQPFVKILLMWAGSEAVEVEGFKDEEGEGLSPVLWTVLQEWRTRIVKGSCNPLFGDQFSCVLQEEKLHHINLRMEVRDFDKFSRNTVLGDVRVPLAQLNISYPLELQEDLKIPQKDLVGEVLLSLKFLPTSQRLEVGLLKVRTVLSEISPNAEVHLERCKILVSIYETRPTSKSAKQLIGQLSVGKEKSSEDEHWTLMMRSVRQPVAKWHGLLI
ncbi:synaptotagmin-2 isoform X3 [Simochromis diagramma]|uniref:synaptotagmin-2 isoform X3 n=1 Tax=Simochromis diagramma TaxID=43689 RepID=UPI001A7EFDC8|nr:synaptotagmin-2 isoform X3 [Simochromis diagramma]